MGDIVLVRPAYHYQSYYDLHAIFEACRLKNTIIPKIDPSSNNIYVYTPSNGEIHDIEKRSNRKCKLVWWQLERFKEPNIWDDAVNKYESGKLDAIIVSDMGYYNELKERGVKVAFCPIGYHPLFGSPNWESKKIYDFVHLSYKDVWRRSKLFTQFNKQFKIAPNGWGGKRAQYLHQSKFLVNTHQDDTRAIEPLRLILAICHGVPIISESIDNPRPYQDGRLYGSTYENLTNTIGKLIRQYNINPHPFIDKAKDNFQYFSENLPFVDTLVWTIDNLMA